MTPLRFHLGLYAADAVDEAIRSYAAYADIESLTEDDYRVVQVSTGDLARERLICKELANAALGLTIEGRSRA